MGVPGLPSWDLPGLPRWDSGAAAELVVAVMSLRCGLDDVAGELRRSAETARHAWDGPTRQRFDEQFARLVQEVDDLRELAEHMPSRVREAGEAYHVRRRMIATAAGVGWLDDAARLARW